MPLDNFFRLGGGGILHLLKSISSAKWCSSYCCNAEIMGKLSPDFGTFSKVCRKYFLGKIPCKI